MNPKDIGKKDWEIKQEFLKSNPMSQEEEKLIEELNEEVWWDPDLSEGENWEKYITPLILKTYRSGKLAGFEMCEGYVNQRIDFTERIRNHPMKVWKELFTDGNSYVLGLIKLFIEEEKKKL